MHRKKLFRIISATKYSKIIEISEEGRQTSYHNYRWLTEDTETIVMLQCIR